MEFTKPVYENDDDMVRRGTAAAALVSCAVCFMPSAVILVTKDQRSPRDHTVIGTTNGLTYWEILKWFPQPRRPNIPEHLPQAVRPILLEAERNRFLGKEGVHTAAMAYGKALDIAFKKVDPALTGSLHERITALGKAGKIGADLATWAGDLRIIRNDSMHEEEPPTVDDVSRIAEATQLIFQYLFTLPGMLAKFKEEPPAQNVKPEGTG